jgi:hypothetical protein
MTAFPPPCHVGLPNRAGSLSDLAAHSDQRERTIEMTLAAGPRARKTVT